MRNLLLIMLIGLLGMQCAGAYEAGDSMPFPQCSPQELLTEESEPGFYSLGYFDDAYGTVPKERFVIRCQQLTKLAHTLYVIEPRLDERQRVIKEFRVIRRIDYADPARLLIQQRRAGSFRTIAENGSDSSIPRVLLYTQDKTNACRDTAEIVAMPIGDRVPAALRGIPRYSRICVPTPESPNDSDAGIDPLNLLDYQLDEAGAGYIVALRNVELLVLEYEPGGKLEQLTRIDVVKQFGRGCGQYLIGARLLPGSTRVALLFRTPGLYTIDYAKPRQPPVTLYNWLALLKDREKAFTCEGGYADYGSQRQRMWIEPLYAQQGERQTLYLLGRDAADAPLLLSFPL